MKTEPLDPRFRLAAPDPERDMQALARIVSDAFAGGGYIDEIIQTYIGNCHYDFPVSRLIWDGDRLAHHWGVWTYPMRLESVTLTVGPEGEVTRTRVLDAQGNVNDLEFRSLKRNAGVREADFEVEVPADAHRVQMPGR